MPETTPTLHLLCGKIAAGKSSLARRLAEPEGTVLISEDDWLAALYPGEIVSLADYVRCSARLKILMGPHVEALLREGLSLVLDFPANTMKQRAWMRQIIDNAGVPHRLHFLDVPDDICKSRLRARNASGSHDFQAGDAEFDVITSHFTPPAPEEGFDVVVYSDPSRGSAVR
jgi:predicted kinase